MERPAQATRRFYNAFYRWASLPTAPHSRPHGVRSGQTYRTSARLLDEGNNRNNVVSNSGLKPAKQKIKATIAHKNGIELGKQKKAHILLSGKVKTPVEHHTEDIKPTGYAIRSRSGEDVTVEICPDAHTLEAVRTIYGNNLNGVLPQAGSTSIKQNKEFDRSGTRVWSLLLSGPYAGVHAVATIFKTFQQNFHQCDPAASFDRAKTVAPDPNTPVQEKIQGFPDFRERSETGGIVDYALLETSWIAAQQQSAIKDGLRSGMIKTGRMWMARGDPSPRQAITIEGTFDQIFEVVTILKKEDKRAFLAKMQEVKDTFAKWKAQYRESPFQSERQFQRSQQRAELANYTRTVLRPLTHPVVIITAGDRDKNSLPLPHGCRGVTVSSFTSVSMAGTAPVFSFNLKLPSRTWDVIRKTGDIRVHLLHGTAEGAALAHAFTQPYEQPLEAFDAIQAMGAKLVESPNKNPKNPPSVKISHPAVMACIHASIIRDLTVTVHDHVVVFASVKRVALLKDNEVESIMENWEPDATAGMLAYGLQGYRSLGSSIATPELPDSLKTQRKAKALSKSATERVAAENGDVTNAESTQQPLPSTETVIEETAEETTEETTSSKDADNTYDLFRAFDERKPSISSEDRPKTEHTSAEVRSAQDAKIEETPEETNNTPIHRSNGTTISPKEPTPKESTARHASSHAWGLPSTSRSFSTLTRSSPLNQRRSYSSSTPKPENTTLNIDPSLDPKTTVQDFLCIPAAAHRPKRSRLLQLHARDADISEQYLARHGDYLSSSDQAKLTARIRRNRRFVTKKRAMSAAEDLERLLDEGKVYARTAPWMEGAVEAGIVVVREEAAEAELALDEGRLGKEVFEAVKHRLEGEHEFLSTQAQRLRDMMQEDEDDFGPKDGGSGSSSR